MAQCRKGSAGARAIVAFVRVRSLSAVRGKQASQYNSNIDSRQCLPDFANLVEEDMDRFGDELLRGVLACRLEVDCAPGDQLCQLVHLCRAGLGKRGRTDEVIPHAPELDLVFELWMPQHLAADGVAAGIGNDHGVSGDVDDAGGEARLELGLEFRRDIGEQLNGREKAVRGGGCGKGGQPVRAACLSPETDGGGAPTGDHLAWSLPIPLLQCNSATISCERKVEGLG